MTKRNILWLIMSFVVATTTQLHAQEDRNRGIIQSALYGLEYEVKAGFNIGGTSPIPLPKEIRALTGMSIVEFLRHIRLDNAERLLKSGKYNVSEVMYMVGFSSLSYFSRAFKKEFGRLPTETSDRKPQK